MEDLKSILVYNTSHNESNPSNQQQTLMSLVEQANLNPPTNQCVMIQY